MILDPASATRFIEGYKRILLQIEQRDGDKDKLSLIQRLVRARAKVLEAPSLIAAALVALDARQQSVDPELGGAICLARAQRAERVQ